MFVPYFRYNKEGYYCARKTIYTYLMVATLTKIRKHTWIHIYFIFYSQIYYDYYNHLFILKLH